MIFTTKYKPQLINNFRNTCVNCKSYEFTFEKCNKLEKQTFCQQLEQMICCSEHIYIGVSDVSRHTGHSRSRDFFSIWQLRNSAEPGFLSTNLNIKSTKTKIKTKIQPLIKSLKQWRILKLLGPYWFLNR